MPIIITENYTPFLSCYETNACGLLYSINVVVVLHLKTRYNGDVFSSALIFLFSQCLLYIFAVVVLVVVL